MSKKHRSSGGFVYSTAHGRMCPGCGKPIKQCQCKKRQSAPKGDGIVRVGRETKGRKGSGVTVITGVPLRGDQLKDLARELKAKCGSGGTIKNGVIEIQGEHRDRLVVLLSEKGYTVKKSGG